MALIIKNTEIGDVSFSGNHKLWVYNALDCCITREVYDALKPQVEQDCKHTYDFERGMFGPAYAMMKRGLKVDDTIRHDLLTPLIKNREVLKDLLNAYAFVIWGKNINHNSPLQLQKFLYDELHISPIKKQEKGRWKISTDRDALEQIHSTCLRARPITNCILALRECDKDISVLTSTRDPDGRLRCSYNVAGTETGRWSSSESQFRTGTNLQNISNKLREIIVPDKDHILFYADLDRAESFAVGYLSGDENYINACKAGDLHTEVCKMVWPHLGWTDDVEADKELAEKPAYMHHSYRDLAKRGGHGTNYCLTYHSMARRLHIKVRDAARFQLLYLGGTIPYVDLARWYVQDKYGGFDSLIEGGEVLGAAPKANQVDKRLVKVTGAFEGIRVWHETIARNIEQLGYLDTPFGRRRHFFGRPNDAATLREAVAYCPQSTVGDLLNLGLYRLYQELYPENVKLLGQVHDAVLGQIVEKKLDDIAPLVVECLVNPINVNGRTMTVPASLEVGYNWAKFNDNPKKGRINLNGIKKYVRKID